MLGQSDSASSGPPPPSGPSYGPLLPIDTYEYILFGAGIALGVFFFVRRKAFASNPR